MADPTLATLTAEVQALTAVMRGFGAIQAEHTDALARIEALLNGAAEPKDGSDLHDALQEIVNLLRESNARLARIEARQAGRPPKESGP